MSQAGAQFQSVLDPAWLPTEALEVLEGGLPEESWQSHCLTNAQLLRNAEAAQHDAAKWFRAVDELATQRARTTAVTDFQRWLSVQTVSVRDFVTCVPEDLGYYYFTHLHKLQAGTPSDSTQAAALDSFDALIFDIAKELDSLGRIGDWDERRKQGKACMHACMACTRSRCSAVTRRGN